MILPNGTHRTGTCRPPSEVSAPGAKNGARQSAALGAKLGSVWHCTLHTLHYAHGTLHTLLTGG